VGGGIFNGGRLTLSRCTIAGNSLGNQLGGGIFNAGTLIVRASTVKANHAGRPGGPGQGGGIHNSLAGDLTLEDSLVLGNSADSLGSGGGLYNVGMLTLNRSAVTFNEATLGGGIYNEGRLALKSSSVVNNVASGVFPHVGRGGGIHNFTDDQDSATLPGTLVMFNSTVSRNEARVEEDGRILRGSGYGGGIYNDEGTMTLMGSTISFNFVSTRSTGSPTAIRGASSRLFEGINDKSSRTIRNACSSESAAKCETPETLLCVTAPPSSSFVTSSCVTVLTTSGPVMNMYDVSLTMMLKSVIAGL